MPNLILRLEGLEQKVFATGTYQFDEVIPEQKLDTFKPDALVRINGNELAVEFLVHHAVGEEKRGKVRTRDISMVEIDLSGLRPGMMEAAELDAAILHHAPRSWIHHRKTAAAKRKLDAVVAEKISERGARLKGHILRARRGRPPADWVDKATAAVHRAGLETLIGIEGDCGHWFTVSDRLWQAQALYAYVIKPSETYSPGGRNLEVKGDFPNERDLSSRLPEWMIRTDLSSYPAKRLSEAGFSSESYGSPHSAVWCYFATLSGMGQAIFWSREDQKFYIERDLQDLLHRRVELHGKRSNATHASTTDPDAMLYRKGSGMEARLCFIGHRLMENRSGLLVDARLTRVSGHAERLAALEMIKPHADRPRAITLGADRGYDAAEFVEELRTLNIRPHVAQNVSGRRSAIDRRTTRHAGYTASLRARKRIEEAFGWIKTVAGLRRTRLRGLARVDWSFTFAAAAYNLIRLPKLLGAPA